MSRQRWIALAPPVVASLAVFPMLALVLRRGVEIPYWDEWAWADFAYGVHRHTLTFAQLWELHGEHRVFAGNLLMLLLSALGGWSVVREQVFSLLMLAATQLVVWLLIRRTVRVGRRGIAFLTATVLLFGLAQEENLSWGFQMAWFLCNLAMVTAVWALLRPRRAAAGLALAAAVVASLASSQGLVIWLAGAAAIGLIRRRGWRLRLPVWLTCGALTTIVVRAGAPGDNSHDHAGLSQPLTLLQFGLAYLGAPLARSAGVGLSVVAGTLVVLALAGLAAYALRGPLAARVRLAPWLAVGTYAVACALVTATGRAGAGSAIALSSRYTSISEYAWIAAAAGACIVIPRVGARAARAAVPAWTALALVACASFVQSAWADMWWKQQETQLRAARGAFANADPGGIKLVNPDPRLTTVKIGWLVQVRDEMFRER